MSWVQTIFPSILLKQPSSEIGLKLSIQSLLPLLNTGMIFAIFNWSGTDPAENDVEKIWKGGTEIVRITCWIGQTEKPRMSGVFFAWSCLVALIIYVPVKEVFKKLNNGISLS